MKKFKIFGCIILVFCLCLGGYILLKKDDYSYYLALGDYVSKTQVLDENKVEGFSSYVGNYLIEENIVNEANSSYLKNNMNSKKLLEMIEKDTYLIDNSSLVELIKKSKYITISLGMNDIINQVKYDSVNKELIYDKDIVSNKIDIFKHNYHEIVEEIKNINKDAKVMLIGSYKIYDNNEITNMINDAVREVASESSVYYIDIDEIRDNYMFNDNALYLNDLGQQVISNKVIGLVQKIESI